jgi:membrane protease YdiL (CAAX protease family)
MHHEIISSVTRVLPFVAILTVLFIRIRAGKIDTNAIFLTRPPKIYVSIGIWFAFLVFILLTEYVFYVTGHLETDPWNHALIPSVIRIAGMVVLAPMTEEIIFRGFLLNVFTKWKGNFYLAVLIQAAFFVLLHSFAYENTFSSNVGIVQSFTDAVIYAYVRNYTRSLYTPIAMHATGNLIAVLERFM